MIPYSICFSSSIPLLPVGFPSKSLGFWVSPEGHMDVRTGPGRDTPEAPGGRSCAAAGHLVERRVAQAEVARMVSLGEELIPPMI